MFQWFAIVDLVCLWIFLDLAQRAPSAESAAMGQLDEALAPASPAPLGIGLADELR